MRVIARYLGRPSVRDKSVLVLLLARHFVCLSDHLRSPPHWLQCRHDVNRVNIDYAVSLPVRNHGIERCRRPRPKPQASAEDWQHRPRVNFLQTR